MNRQATGIKVDWQRAAKVLGGCRWSILDDVLPNCSGNCTKVPGATARQFLHRTPTRVEVCDVEGGRCLARVCGPAAQERCEHRCRRDLLDRLVHFVGLKVQSLRQPAVGSSMV